MVVGKMKNDYFDVNILGSFLYVTWEVFQVFQYGTFYTPLLEKF